MRRPSYAIGLDRAILRLISVAAAESTR